MVSFADIPDHLKPAHKKTDFIAWLATMPLDQNVKRKLIADWRLNNHISFSPLDFQIALAPLPKAG